MSSTRSQRLWSGVTSSASPQHTTPRPLPGPRGSSRCIYQNLTLSIPAYIYTMQCVECRSLDAKVHAAIHASVHHEQDITIYIYLLGCSNTTATKLRRRCFTCVYVSVARTVDSMHGVTKHAADCDVRQVSRADAALVPPLRPHIPRRQRPTQPALVLADRTTRESIRAYAVGEPARAAHACVVGDA